jgi:putative DNA primase/helicase
MSTHVPTASALPILNVDLGEARRFLDALDPGGIFAFQTFPDGEDATGAPWIATGALDNHAGRLIAANRQGLGVFVTINETDGRGRKTENVIRVRAVFVDLDGSPLEPAQECELPPHIIVESSPGRFHAYWLVDGLPLDEFSTIQKCIASLLHGDPHVHDLPRVMRLPGFFHLKGEPFRTRLIELDDAPPYSADEVRQAFRLPETPPKPRPILSASATTTKTNGAARYIDAALRNEIARVAEAPEGSRNDSLNKAAYNLGQLVTGAGLDEQRVREALLGAGLAAGLAESECRATIASGLSRGKEQPRAIPERTKTPAPRMVSTPPRAGLPKIRVLKGALPETVGDAIEALKADGVQIFSRGGELVRPVRLETSEVDKGVRRDQGSLVLWPVEDCWLRLEMARSAVWTKFDTRREGFVPTDPPKEIAEFIVSAPDVGDWPHLQAVARHPVLFPDGRRIDAPGYDPDSGLFLDIEGEWPPIQERPSQDDAVRARETIEHLLRFYPFAGDVDRAVALSLLTTAVMRPALDLAPGHALDAPVRGAGKSMMIDAAAILVTGAKASVLEHSKDQPEMVKRLDAALLAGDPLIAIDNIEGNLEGAALCQTISQGTRRIRPLGGSKMVDVPCTALITFTGNNLTLKGDITRRVLTCRLMPDTERPELRVIPQDLHAEVRERRGELVAALQTIVKAYIAAGCPDLGLPPYGGFRTWDRTVRHALVWCGAADPLEVLNKAHEENPERQNLLALLEAWHNAFGDEPVTAADALDRAERNDALKAALAAVALRRGELDGLRLGYWLRQHRDAMAGGYVLRRGARGKAGYLWQVIKIGVDGVDVSTLRGNVREGGQNSV